MSQSRKSSKGEVKSSGNRRKSSSSSRKSSSSYEPPYGKFLELCEKGESEELKKLMKEHPTLNPSHARSLGLRKAARNGHLNIISFLLQDERVDPSKDNNRLLREACMGEFEKIVLLLLNDKRVDPSDWGNEAIRYAAFFGDETIVRMLMRDERVDPEDNSRKNIVLESKSALQIAREKKHFHLLPILERKEETKSTNNDLSSSSGIESFHMSSSGFMTSPRDKEEDEELNMILSKYSNIDEDDIPDDDVDLSSHEFGKVPPVRRKLVFDEDNSGGENVNADGDKNAEQKEEPFAVNPQGVKDDDILEKDGQKWSAKKKVGIVLGGVALLGVFTGIGAWYCKCRIVDEK